MHAWHPWEKGWFWPRLGLGSCSPKPWSSLYNFFKGTPKGHKAFSTCRNGAPQVSFRWAKRPFSTQCHGSFESFQKTWHDTEQSWDHSKPQQGHCQPLQNPALSTMLKMISEHILSLLKWISIPKTSFSLWNMQIPSLFKAQRHFGA